MKWHSEPWPGYGRILDWDLGNKKKGKTENMEGSLMAAFFRGGSHERRINRSINKAMIFPPSHPVLVARRVGFMVY